MFKRLFRFFVVLSTVFVFSAHAAEDVRGALDPQGYQRFEDSWIVAYDRQSTERHELPTGPMIKVNGVTQPQRSIQVAGNLVRVTYQLPEGVDPNQAFSFFEKQIQAKGYEPRYVCKSRSCGASSYWASDIFKERLLYGEDRDQQYALYQWPEGQSDKPSVNTLALYSVMKPNRRAYVHLDLVGDTAASGGVIRREVPVVFSDNDRLVTPGLDGDFEALVKQHRQASMWLVSSLSGDGDPQTLLDRSLSRAAEVKRLLVQEGVAPSAVQLFSRGPFTTTNESNVELWIYPRSQ
ncbi:DUF4892 domain-containing protein [Pokkaliibacter sp. CJK22405]|uniref:DUF4892 domain-containing protein n=1 Tax=Pokkaliibacter sp. CJK22405 TaxID=3384615 RepID=UPI00398483AB